MSLAITSYVNHMSSGMTYDERSKEENPLDHQRMSLSSCKKGRLC